MEFRLTRMSAHDVQSSNLLPCEPTVASRRSDHPRELQFRMLTVFLVVQPANPWGQIF